MSMRLSRVGPLLSRPYFQFGSAQYARRSLREVLVEFDERHVKSYRNRLLSI